MPRKTTVAATKASDVKFALGPKQELVRVEERIEDFISMMLPSLPGTKLQICPLWTDALGKSYFRCKFWKYIVDDIVVTRKEQRSYFVSVENLNGNRVLTNLTRDALTPMQAKTLAALIK